ncbi:MAG: VirK/YbjX family protein [Gammaproteobacteria bacterium]
MIGERAMHDADVIQESLSTRVPASTSIASRWRKLKDVWRIAFVIYPSANKHRHAKRVRFVFRALSDFSTWRSWYGFLKTSPFDAITRYCPRLYEKPLRPYLHKDLTSAECHRVLREHYHFLRCYTPAELVSAILNNEPFILNQHSLGDLREPLIINFTYSKHMQQEGELTLSLGRPESVNTIKEHEWIASLTFVIRFGASGWEIFIGGVQGGRTPESKEDTKHATRVFHGLRPKHLLVYILREVAAAWGITRIYAIGNSVHCFMRHRYQDRISMMKSSYDELWNDVGGRPETNGFFLLPPTNTRRSLHTIPSRKRAQYLRRFALLDNIDSEIREKLTVKKNP